MHDPNDTLFPAGYGEIDPPNGACPEADGQPCPPPAPTVKWPELTAREIEVANAIAHGIDRKEITKSMGISVKTYDTHRGHVLKKLGLKNVAQLTIMAIRRGAVSL